MSGKKEKLNEYLVQFGLKHAGRREFTTFRMSIRNIIVIVRLQFRSLKLIRSLYNSVVIRSTSMGSHDSVLVKDVAVLRNCD